MPLVSSKKMLQDARDCGYAVAAFNIENMEMAQAVIFTAEKLKSPVICAISENALKYGDASLYCAMVRSLANAVSVPIAIHVDHAESEATVFKALRGGFTSIMIDGSKLAYIDNVQLTKRIVDICNIFNVPVEGELGAIGGKIDSLPDSDLIYTDPYAAKDFVEKTGVSFLAVAIGTAHGIYKDTPRLDYERLSKIRETIDVPLVLHGASGLSDDQVTECIKRGITKINIATELRIAYTNAVREFLSNDKDTFDPKKYSKKGREAVAKVVEEKLYLMGSVNRCQ